MLEHMAFKGTATRSARAIAEEIEAVGGMLNAYTSREQTAFHARILKQDVPLALDMIADILTNPTFEQAELERERQVVLQELGQARDTPDDIVFDHLQAAIFKDQPLGWPILGDEKTVSAFDRAMLKDYMAAQYRLEGMTLIASGAVDHAEILRLAEEKCGGLNPGPGCRAAAGPLCRRRFPRDRGSGTGAYRLRLSGPQQCRSGLFRRPDLCHGAGRRHLFAPVPGSAGEARPLLFHLCLLQRLPGFRLSRRLCRHRRSRSGGHLRRDRRRDGGDDATISPRPKWRAPAPS